MKTSESFLTSEDSFWRK